MKKSCLRPKQASRLVMQHSVEATSRCKRFNGNGALWCVEKTWPAGLKAG